MILKKLCEKKKNQSKIVGTFMKTIDSLSFFK